MAWPDEGRAVAIGAFEARTKKDIKVRHFYRVRENGRSLMGDPPLIEKAAGATTYQKPTR